MSNHTDRLHVIKVCYFFRGVETTVASCKEWSGVSCHPLHLGGARDHIPRPQLCCVKSQNSCLPGLFSQALRVFLPGSLLGLFQQEEGTACCERCRLFGKVALSASQQATFLHDFCFRSYWSSCPDIPQCRSLTWKCKLKPTLPLA